MKNLNSVIEKHYKHPNTKKENSDDIRSKATGYVNDGLFDHHATFYYIDGDFFFYKQYFGKGWHKRKIDKNGFCKFLNSLVINVNTLSIYSRKAYYDGRLNLLMHC